MKHLDAAYEELLQLAIDRRTRLGESRKLWQFYWDMADEEGWIKEKEQLMSSPDLGHDLTSVHLLLNKHKVTYLKYIGLYFYIAKHRWLTVDRVALNIQLEVVRLFYQPSILTFKFGSCNLAALLHFSGVLFLSPLLRLSVFLKDPSCLLILPTYKGSLKKEIIAQDYLI